MVNGEWIAPHPSPLPQGRGKSVLSIHHSPFTIHAFANSAQPRFANSSALSFPSSPAWPFTHSHSMSCWAETSSRRRQRSSFLTGFLSVVRQPFFFHLLIQPLMPSCTYWESV